MITEDIFSTQNLFMVMRWYLGFCFQIIPVAYICIYPFKGQFKKSKRYFYSVLTLVFFVASFIFIWTVSWEYFSNFRESSNYILLAHIEFLLTLFALFLVFIFGIKSRLIYKIFVFLIGVNYGAVIEIISRTLFTFFNLNVADLYPTNFLVSTLVLNCIFFMPMIKLMDSIKESFNSEINEKIWKSLSYILFGIIIIINFFYDLPYASYLDRMKILSSFICMIGVFVFILYYWILKVIREERLRIENQLKWEMLVRNYELDSNNTRKLLEIRHEVKHHISALGLYLKNEDYKGAEEYLEKFSQLEHELPVHDYGADRMLNLILSDYQSRIEHREIISQFEISVDNPLNIEDVDLIQLFSNILDNAIEATENLESEKRIKLIVKQRGYFLTIVCKNTFDKNKLKKADSKITSSKQTSTLEEHGIGLKLIKRIVEKYNGFQRIEIDNQVFSITANLCLDDKKEGIS